MKSTTRKNIVYERTYSQKTKLKRMQSKAFDKQCKERNKKIFVENPNLMFEYLDKDKSGSAEIFTTDSLNDKEQNVRIGFSLGTISFFFVNCTKNLRFTHIDSFINGY